MLVYKFHFSFYQSKMYCLSCFYTTSVGDLQLNLQLHTEYRAFLKTTQIRVRAFDPGEYL